MAGSRFKSGGTTFAFKRHENFNSFTALKQEMILWRATEI